MIVRDSRLVLRTSVLPLPPAPRPASRWGTVRGDQRDRDLRPGRWGHPHRLGLPATGEKALARAQRGSPARNISRADTFMTWARLQNTGRCAAPLSLPSLSSHARPRLPLGVRKAHIFPSPDRPSDSRQVQKANKSPARSPCIYQSGGLSSSRLDPHESRQQRAGRGRAAASRRIWPQGRGHLVGAGGGAPMFAAPRGPQIYTPPFCTRFLWL